MPFPLPKLRELKEAIRALIRGPYTLPRGEARVAAAYRGFPQYYEDQCIGCATCFHVCPPRAIELEDNRETRTRVLTICLDNCITCGQCQASCPTKEGIKNTREYDQTTVNRADLRQRSVRKELILCESCAEIVGAKEHILWVARRLGPLAYSNPTLLLAGLQAAGVAAPEPPGDIDRGLQRGDKLRILCPRCRQEVSFLA